MTTAEQVRINTVIREHMANLNGSLGTREVAEAAIVELSPEQVHGLAIEGLIDRVLQVTASMRPKVKLSSKSSPSSRWETVKEAQDILEDFWVGFEDRAGKRLLDCSVPDLEDAAEGYEYRAETNRVRAESFRKLAAKLRRSKGSVVADLDRDEVRRIFNA